MACDPYDHHYFFDHDKEEDFYRSIAPSEDIWKKFELVTTPPASPTWIPHDRLDFMADFLEPDEGDPYKLDTTELFSNWSPIILRDCMWSGLSTAAGNERMEKMVSPNCGVQRVNTHRPALTPDSGLGGHSAVECVDPGVVFPYPVADNKIPTSSGSESQSDSEEDGEEEEEIDVVTVEKRQSAGVRKPVTITVRADPMDPCMKLFHISIHQQQHNYAAPSPDSCLEEEPPPKKVKHEPTCRPPPTLKPEPICLLVKPVSKPTSPPEKPKPTSPQSSDSEDLVKRKNHNFMERKRRNDLRSRFLALRDEVPELMDGAKTPKVVILSKATQYLQFLVVNERNLVLEKKQLKSKQQQLLKRIAELKRHLNTV